MKQKKLLFLLTLLMAATQTFAAEYGLWVANIQVTDANKNDVLGDGGKVKFSYDTSTGVATVTLNNANINHVKESASDKSAAFYYGNSPLSTDTWIKIEPNAKLKINLVGTNVITTNASFAFYYGCTFMGSGTLAINLTGASAQGGIDGNLTLDSNFTGGVSIRAVADGVQAIRSPYLLIFDKSKHKILTASSVAGTLTEVPESKYTAYSGGYYSVSNLGVPYLNFGQKIVGYTNPTLALPKINILSGTMGPVMKGEVVGPGDFSVAVSGGQAPYKFTATGLPVGLSIDENTGAVTGTYLSVGSASVITITVTDLWGNTSSKFFNSRVVFNSNLTLTDGEDYTTTFDVDVDAVSYKRTYPAGVWQAFYVPFDVTIDNDFLDKFDMGEIFAICPVKDTNGDGVIDSKDDLYMIVSRLTLGRKTIANMPYVIRAKQEGQQTLTEENCTLYKAKNGSITFATSRTDYKVEGVYAGKTLTPGDNNYYLTKQGTLSYRASSSATLGANRWYMHATPRTYGSSSSSASAAKLAQTMSIAVLGEDLDEATAVKAAKGELTVKDQIFTVGGSKVQNLGSQPAGIYIINGNKVNKK